MKAYSDTCLSSLECRSLGNALSTEQAKEKLEESENQVCDLYLVIQIDLDAKQIYIFIQSFKTFSDYYMFTWPEYVTPPPPQLKSVGDNFCNN